MKKGMDLLATDYDSTFSWGHIDAHDIKSVSRSSSNHGILKIDLPSIEGIFLYRLYWLQFLYVPCRWHDISSCIETLDVLYFGLFNLKTFLMQKSSYCQ